MLSGRRLDLLNPSPVDIELEDIAHGLAFVARWNGQTTGEFPFSVAEHSLLVELIFGRLRPNHQAKWSLAALFHDAAEYVIGDIISPVKGAVGTGYAELEDLLMAAIRIRFGLPTNMPDDVEKQIKRADRISAWLEATQIAGFSEQESNRMFGPPPKNAIKGLKLSPGHPSDVRLAFEVRTKSLLKQLDRYAEIRVATN